jgi:hypothetical protein
MKTNLFLLLLISSFTSFSQTCDNFYFFQKNKTVEMTITNKKDKETGKTVYTISDVNKTSATVSSTVNSEIFDAKGKSIAKGASNIKCTGGVMMIDMKMFISPAQQQQMNMEAAGGAQAFIEYPANMKEGDKYNQPQSRWKRICYHACRHMGLF